MAPSGWEEWGKEGDCLMATAFPLGMIKPGTIILEDKTGGVVNTDERYLQDS